MLTLFLSLLKTKNSVKIYLFDFQKPFLKTNPKNENKNNFNMISNGSVENALISFFIERKLIHFIQNNIVNKHNLWYDQIWMLAKDNEA